MDRIILHSDINACYASIEHAQHPELDGHPVAVGGSVEQRHGIILAKDEAAKRCGVKTGMAIWQAQSLCPALTILPPRMELYLKYCRCIQQIYAEYTDLRESFGIDESWLDLTGCTGTADGESAAREIKRRIKKEMGVTVSVGVSWNKVFAKLGSDYRKPDAVTSITRQNFRDILWPLPVENLLYVGRATSAKLRGAGIRTIGELAGAEPELLRAKLGKMGYVIHGFANGLDTSPVRREGTEAPLKSVSNSTTPPHDLVNDEDLRLTLLALAENVAARLRRHRLAGRCVTVSVRSPDLNWHGHQTRLETPTDITRELFSVSMALFHSMHIWPQPIRSLGLCVSELTDSTAPEQLDMFGESERRFRQRRMDASLDQLREKYGFGCIRRGFSDSGDPFAPLRAKDGSAAGPFGFSI